MANYKKYPSPLGKNATDAQKEEYTKNVAEIKAYNAQITAQRKKNSKSLVITKHKSLMGKFNH